MPAATLQFIFHKMHLFLNKVLKVCLGAQKVFMSTKPSDTMQSFIQVGKYETIDIYQADLTLY